MRHDGPFRVCFVCSGNICRSPMAEVVLRGLADAAGYGDRIKTDSAGVGDWHIGERADRRTVSALAASGYDGTRHRARQFDPGWFSRRELVIALDRGHEQALRACTTSEADRAKVRLLRSFDPAVGAGAAASTLDVPDPYYDGDRMFTTVLGQVETACRGLLTYILDRLDHPARGGPTAHAAAIQTPAFGLPGLGMPELGIPGLGFLGPGLTGLG